MAGIMKDGKPYFFGSGESYSTEEQVIGTWIDGKPLYQKVFEIENISRQAESQWAQLFNTGLSDVQLIDYIFTCCESDKSSIRNTREYCAARIVNRYFCAIAPLTFEASTNAKVILKYIKTTD